MAYSDSRTETSMPNLELTQKEPKKKKVVVLGTGWAGTSFLKDLDIKSYDVQVVSPRNYFAFTPLLPSVTCGTVEARSIVEPVRNIIKKVIHCPRYLSCYEEGQMCHKLIEYFIVFPASLREMERFISGKLNVLRLMLLTREFCANQILRTWLEIESSLWSMTIWS